MSDKQNCLNCRYCRIAGDFIVCREEPGVVDHAFNIRVSEAKRHVCENFHYQSTLHWFRNIKRETLAKLVKDAVEALSSTNQYDKFTILIDTEADESAAFGNEKSTEEDD